MPHPFPDQEVSLTFSGRISLALLHFSFSAFYPNMRPKIKNSCLFSPIPSLPTSSNPSILHILPHSSKTAKFPLPTSLANLHSVAAVAAVAIFATVNTVSLIANMYCIPPCWCGDGHRCCCCFCCIWACIDVLSRAGTPVFGCSSDCRRDLLQQQGNHTE